MKKVYQYQIVNYDYGDEYHDYSIEQVSELFLNKRACEKAAKKALREYCTYFPKDEQPSVDTYITELIIPEE